MTAVGPCPICGGRVLPATTSHEADGTRYTLHGCDGCGLEHWQPLAAPHAAYYEGEEQAMYAAMHDGRRRADEDPRFARFLDEFASCSGKRLLDVGCADGVLMDAFRARGNTVTGIDIDNKSLRAARARGLDVHEATLDNIAGAIGRDIRFDLVTMFDVLEHLTAPRRALEVARSLLVPGGRLVGTVPNRERLFANLVSADFPPHHFLRFDCASVGAILRLVDFVPVHVDVFQWGYAGPVLVNAATKTAKKLVRRPTTREGVAAVDTPGGSRKKRRFKHRVADVLNLSAAGALRLLERGLRRGFKLYFVARRAT